jgi:hypothetical protein
MEESNMAGNKVSGACHCGQVSFTIQLPEVLEGPFRCNCTLCRRKGAIMASVPKEDFTLDKGQEHLSMYQWNTHIAKHYFCNQCGIYTHHQRRSKPDHIGFNTGCVAELNDAFSNSEIPMFDGASMSAD